MAKPTPEEVEQLHAQTSIDRAWSIREEYQNLLERRRANREELRRKLVMGVLTDEQRADVEELYPARNSAAEEVEEATAEPQAA